MAHRSTTASVCWAAAWKCCVCCACACDEMSWGKLHPEREREALWMNPRTILPLPRTLPYSTRQEPFSRRTSNISGAGWGPRTIALLPGSHPETSGKDLSSQTDMQGRSITQPKGWLDWMSMLSQGSHPLIRYKEEPRGEGSWSHDEVVTG